MSGAAEWDFLRNFHVPIVSTPRWVGALALTEAFAALGAQARDTAGRVLVAFDREMAELGGDPIRQDWTRFRPLRLSREEDWSDWLAWLLESSQSMHLTKCLCSTDVLDGTSPAVSREEPAGAWRLDLVARWSDNTATTIEVKVGDPSIDKTAPAAAEWRQRNHGIRGADVLLLPRWQLPDWEALGIGSRVRVTAVTWDEVAVALRRGLMDRREAPQWRLLARAFVGAIEQTILGLPRGNDDLSPHRWVALARHLEALLAKETTK